MTSGMGSSSNWNRMMRSVLYMLTNEDWKEEECDGNVHYRCRHVQKPVGRHGKESQKEQKEEETVFVLLHLGETWD